MSGRRWSRRSLVGAGALLAQLGMAESVHSQSAGSVGVTVNVVEAVDVLGAAEAVDDKERQDGHAVGSMPYRSRQPAAGRPVLVEVEPRGAVRLGEAEVRRVTVVVP